MSGAEADYIHRAKELIMEAPVTFLKYAQEGDRGRSAKENAGTDGQNEEIWTRESYPKLYPGEVVGENEASREPTRHRRNMAELTGRAKANQHRKDRKEEKHKNKRLRLAEGENSTRRVQERPELRLGGGEWEWPPHREDKVARRFLGGQDGRGLYKVFKDETMNLAHEEKYAGHPILRLFTQPEEMENGHTCACQKRISHISGQHHLHTIP
eukprot:6193155-Pleurochrysis_carterae.AAC.1